MSEMKVTKILLGFVFLIAAVCALSSAQEAKTPSKDKLTLEELYQDGLFKETGERDLNAAIAVYEKIADQHQRERQLVAKALYRAGVCYKKLGEYTKSKQAFRRIIDEFADQSEVLQATQKEMLDFKPTVKIVEKVKLDIPNAGPIRIADVDGDGKNELIVGTYTKKKVELFDKTKRVSLNFADAELKNVLKFIASEANLKISGEQYLEGKKATLTHLTDVTIDKALEHIKTILAVYNLTMVITGKTIRITSVQEAELIDKPVNGVGVYVYEYEDGSYRQSASIVRNELRQVSSIAVGDTNNDGNNDIVVSWKGWRGGPGPEGSSADIVIYQPKQGEIFNEVWNTNVNSIRTSRAISIGDANNDGVNELLIGVTFWDRYITIYEYDRDQDDYIEVWRDNLGSDFHSAVAADADNDGKPEIVAGTAEWGTYDVRVYEGAPGERWYELSWSEKLGGIQEAVVGDVNNDGKNEILVTSSYEDHMRRGNEYGCANIFQYDGANYELLWTSPHYSCEKPFIGDALNIGTNQFAFISLGDEHLYLYEYNGVDYVEAWKTAIKTAFPRVRKTKILNDVLIGDVNNDGKNELVFSSESEGVYIYSLKGVPPKDTKE